ncbi:PASTA domain-containing protein [Mycolicibacterium pyrenivorans]|uniref:PASTA domain-containing protein n=1 Tax=Mycolicibacterium pyrenivorans TaxID=187102 RepID=UPI0021F3B95C|nr:PASTA domain-containing protein [Mycolicibacterium pyrenivorans]MCV7149896.1 PASTA domain-containing protein [Mycolicibacterium pyrenivorans]
MRRQIIAMTVAVLAATIGFAGQAGAETSSEWEMPNVRNMVLQQAIDAVYDVTGPVDLKFDLLDKVNGQDVLNLTNWEVCAQNPSAGAQISKKTMKVTFYAKRFNQTACV